MILRIYPARLCAALFGILFALAAGAVTLDDGDFVYTPGGIRLSAAIGRDLSIHSGIREDARLNVRLLKIY